MGLLGSYIACTIGASAIGITALSIPFISPAFRRVCIPYVPASNIQIQNVLYLLKKVPLPVAPIIDLGSGDGRVVSTICIKKNIFIFFFIINFLLITFFLNYIK